MPLTTADRLEILNLAARYNHAFDSQQSDAWADTFTPDGIFESSNGRAVGREELRLYNANREGATTRRHWIDNIVIEGDGDTAQLRCYLWLIDITKGGAPVTTGAYNDDLTRIDGVWKFTHRRVSRDPCGPRL